MGVNHAAIRVGRLIEVGVRVGYRTAADVDVVFDEIAREIAKHPVGQKFVTCADWRYCAVMNAQTCEQLRKRLTLVNARVERSVAVARPDSPTAVMQFMRLIREAQSPSRKVFFDPEEAIDWLAEVLTPAETARLRTFLNAPAGQPARIEGERGPRSM
ncbi:MAG TPA: hypothetical protein VE987_13080 [Polyangiaceae bacterium]|nr:hypothetical protein [Polyangiaceae bacterium]